MKRIFRDFYFSHIDPKRIISRIRDGERDLKCALPHSLPVSKEQMSEIKAFWHPYVKNMIERKAFDVRWFDVYNRTNVFGEPLHWYIPDGYYYAVVDPYFNDSIRCKFMDDKNLYDLYFNDVNQAQTICRKEGNVFLNKDYHIISKEEAIKLCKQKGAVILKPSVQAWAGAGIKKWILGQNSDVELEESLSVSGSFIIQELIQQHSSLAQFNDTCVNTMRIVSLTIGNTVEIVTSVLIMGGKGAFTNHLHRGGLICGINTDGSLRSVAFDGSLNQYEKHPCGADFVSCSIPNYYKCINLVKDLAPRLISTSRLAAWDLTLDKTGEPLLIEVNLEYGGVVQKAAGPIFGERTKEILDYIHRRSIK